MFDNQRYVTQGVEATLTLELQSFLWALIDEMCQSDHTMDYLQVFNLHPDQDAMGDTIQVVLHTQEEPDYQAVYNIYLPEPPIKAKIYIIDDKTHSTMLLASEY